MTNLTGRAAALLAAAHARPGLTRAEAARVLGVGSGASTELVGRLAAAGLVAERAAPPSGSRGRPTTELVAHPRGPLVLAAALTQEAWTVEVVELGGQVLATVGARHPGSGAAGTVAAMGAAVRRLRRRFPGRIRGLGISAPGTIRAGHLLDATMLRWHEVDLRAVWPRADLFLAGNDATLAALAESSRGAAAGTAQHLHLEVAVGLGGAVVDHGRLLAGANGIAGEFGHMPFGDPAVRCPCGATGCWGTAVDGTALARLLGDDPPPDPLSYAGRVLDQARAADGPARTAAHTAAGAFGRGIAGLVNALDPDLVTVGGLGSDLLAAAPDAVDTAYRAGLMDVHRADPPPVRPAALGDRGPLTGAAEEVWARLWRRLSF